jgi:hypothetical protein
MNRGFEARRYQSAKECPCGKSNKDGKFAPFKGETKFGKCHSCSQTFFPPDEESNAPITNQKQKYISKDEVAHSQTFINSDPFFQFCQRIIGDYQVATDHLISMGVGSRANVTVFWMIDEYGRVCLPKNVQYNASGDRTSIKPEMTYSATNNFYPCLFNACSLPTNEDATVMLVESEKTAVLAQYFFPNYVWVSSGGATNLSYNKAVVMKGRNVIVLFDPDEAGRTGAEKALEFLTKAGANAKSLDLVPERIDGYDIADMIRDRHKDQDFMDTFLGMRLKKASDELVHGNVDEFEKGIVDIDIEIAVYRYLNDIKDRGETSHFLELDPAFKWKRGLVYTYTGYAGSGKSEINLFLAFLKAKKDGWRFLMFVPESMSSDEEGHMTVEEVYDTLAHIYWGKAVDMSDPMRQSEREYREALAWVKEHFTIMYPNGGFATQKQLTEQASYIIKTRGKHDCVIVDPFNNVVSSQEKNELLDDYIRRMYMEAKLFAVNNRMAWVYITHPSKQPVSKDGSLPPLDMFSIRGGMASANGSDFVIIVERPYYFMGEVQDEKLGTINGRNHPAMDYSVKKVKNQKLLGCRPNTVRVYFSKMRNRFENESRLSPLDEAYEKYARAVISGPQKFPNGKNDDKIQLSLGNDDSFVDITHRTTALFSLKEEEEEEDDMPF